MGALLAVITPLGFVNEVVLKLGRAIGGFAVALMVIAILVQVFFRYVLNSALPWPDEAARFCMLWMAGLMAPTAFRRCLLYTSPSPRDLSTSRMPSSA